MVFVVLCSTGSASGFKASQKKGLHMYFQLSVIRINGAVDKNYIHVFSLISFGA